MENERKGQADIKFILHALRHVRRILGKETSEGGVFLRRKDSGEEEECTEGKNRAN